jgi:hypothetical protein
MTAKKIAAFETTSFLYLTEEPLKNVVLEIFIRKLVM